MFNLLYIDPTSATVFATSIILAIIIVAALFLTVAAAFLAIVAGIIALIVFLIKKANKKKAQ